MKISVLLADHGVKPADFFRPERFVNGLENHRNVVETGVVHQKLKSAETKLAGTDAVVAVQMSAELALRVVQMHAAEITEADQTLEFIHRSGVAFRSFEVVAGGKGVAGVKTDANAGPVFDALDDACEMLEPPASVAFQPK